MAPIEKVDEKESVIESNHLDTTLSEKPDASAYEYFVSLSALQHVCFCERQYALIYLENCWDENRFTAEGKTIHERVHAEHHEKRRLFRQEYALRVASSRWRLSGQCDLVEIWYNENGAVEKASPVEFKRGKRKIDDRDRVQLCAQALCLEDMLDIPIPNGQFYYAKEKRRVDVSLDDTLREKTIALAARIREIEQSGVVPPARADKKPCASCSLLDWCLPHSGAKTNIERYIKEQLRAQEEYLQNSDKADDDINV